MGRTPGRIAAAVLIAVFSFVLPASAQRGRAESRRPPAPGVYVFVGGYFWDMRAGTFPWWTRRQYPYPYFPVYSNVADIRLQVTPKAAAVFVDGFYAGIVDDFNGFFESLTLPPGGHEFTLYLEGYRTAVRRIYLSPGATFRLKLDMAPLATGEESEEPVLAPAVPPPPPGTFMSPNTPHWLQPPLGPSAGAPGAGVLSLRVAPVNAGVAIDGRVWSSCDGQRFVIEVAPGTHMLEVSQPGYRPFAMPIVMRPGETLSLNITLTRLP